MTIATETSRSGPYAGAGSAGPFTVGFRFLDQSHLQVVKTSTAGVDSTLTLSTNYTVSGAGNPTGSVTLTSALLTGEKLTIIRKVPFTQEADYLANDTFPAESHETALDKLTQQTQQLAEVQTRTLQFTASNTGSPTLPASGDRANKILSFDASGNPVTLAPSAGSATALILDLASSSGASTIGTPLGTVQVVIDTLPMSIPADPAKPSKIPTTLNIWIQNSGVNMFRDYGIILNDATKAAQNTTRINAAIADLPLSGGILNYEGKSGRLHIGAGVNINKFSVAMIGKSSSPVIFYMEAHDNDMISVNQECFVIDGMGFGATTHSAAAGARFCVNGAGNEMKLYNISARGCDSFVRSGGAKTDFDGLYIKTTKPGAGTCINYYSNAEVRSASRFVFENAAGANGYAGVLIEGGNGLRFSNFDMFKQGSAMAVELAAGVVVSGLAADTGHFDTNSSHGFRFTGTDTSELQRVKLGNMWISGNAGAGVKLSGIVKGFSVGNSEICQNSSDGFSYDPISATATSFSDGIRVNGCTVAGNGGAGFYAKANAGNFILTGNRMGPTNGYGANNFGVQIVAGTSNGYIVSDNDLRGNTTANLSDGGSGVNKIVTPNLV